MNKRIEYCFNDESGDLYEYSTLSEAIKEAKRISKEQPEHEFNIYAMSSIFIKNGREIRQ